MKNILFAGLSLTVVGACTTQQSVPAKKPNILYIMSDDHAYQAVGVYGFGLNRTPNIDRIAREGMRFNNCFVTNSISGPSRAVMLTGKFSHKNGFYDNGGRTIFDGSQQTLPKLLQEAGYHTGIVGKWHLKSTPTGFDYYSIHYDQGQYYNPDFMEEGEERVRYEGYATDLTADNAIQFIQNSDTDKPFCLLMHFKAPHREWYPAPNKLSMYEDVTFPLPATFYDNYEGRIAAQQQKMRIDNDMLLGRDLKTVGEWDTIPPGEFRRMTPEQRSAWDAVYNPIISDFAQKRPTGNALIEWKYQRYLRDYLKCISSVDDNVGRVLNYLEQIGELDNTIIIYTSDQGFYLGEHGWFDKRFMYEESLKTPFVIRYPKAIKSAGSVTNAMIQNLDFAPTLLDLAGVSVPNDIQGESFKEVLTGKKQTAKEALYYHYYEYPMPHAVKKHYGVRTDRYKLIHFYNDIDEWELFDLQNDPNEMKNLIHDPSQAENIKSLKVKLAELQVKYEDTDPTSDAYLAEQLAFSKKNE
ncbi:MAG: sulfatase [Tannerella sp.]|jgi:arylsulfatase A-like enzyme|nr:sulfatase [Tannerella sp.]